MRRFQIFSSAFLMLMATGVLACDDTNDDTADTADEADNGDGDGETDAETTDDDAETDTAEDDTNPGCWTQPEECARLIECLDVILPGTDLSQFEADGSCWCGSTSDEANACRNTCIEQLDLAVSQNPTEGACHGRVCPIEEIATDEPYGPPPCSGGTVELNSLPVPGSYCAPACGGVAQSCAEHSQTIAQGTCYWAGNPDDLCALRCFVDPYIYESGTQCQCGAICRPYGGADADGNQRGICTYD